MHGDRIGTESVELTETEFPNTLNALRLGVSERVAPGFVAGLWRASEPGRVRLAAAGERRRFPAGLAALPMRTDTVFDLASVTKVFATATLAARLVDRGWLGWNTPLQALLPDYPGAGIELRHLLSHTAGLPAWEPLWERLRERFAGRDLPAIPVAERQRAMRELVCAVKPEARPGERAVYSDICFLLLGFALEEATRMPLDRAVAEFLWKPLDLRSAYYSRTDRAVDQGRREEVAATEDCPWRRGVLQGQVHDDNCWAMGGYAGHAGAFANSQDVLRFAGRLLTGGVLSPAVRLAAWTPVDHPAGCGRTLGWDTPTGENPALGRGYSPRAVGHLGFTGTSLWIDPDRGLAITLFSNRVHPSRENIAIRAFRPRFHEALRRDLENFDSALRFNT